MLLKSFGFTPFSKPESSVPFFKSPRHLVSSIQQINLIFDAYNMLSIYKDEGENLIDISQREFFSRSKTSYKNLQNRAAS